MASNPGTKTTGRGWALDADQAQRMVLGARNALIVMTAALALVWILQIVDVAERYRLVQEYGIRARDVSSLPYLATAPFLHFSWSHIEGNSGPLFIFGFLAAYRGLLRFAGLTVVVILTSGLAAWFFEPAHSVGAGASGVVFGYFGYIIVRGLFDRQVVDVLIGAIMALCFAYQFSVLLPHQGIGWQAHLGGLVGGVASGWIFRDRKALAARRAAAEAAPAAVTGAPGSGGTWPLPGAAATRTPAPAIGTGTGAPAKEKAGKDKAGKDKPGKAASDPTRKGFAADAANPRADLHKQLDDLDL